MAIEEEESPSAKSRLDLKGTHYLAKCVQRGSAILETVNGHIRSPTSLDIIFGKRSSSELKEDMADDKKGKDKSSKKKKKNGATSESKHESEYKKGFRPVLWLTPDFPLQTEELLPLLDILANKVKATFILRARVLKLYRQALRVAHRAPTNVRGNCALIWRFYCSILRNLVSSKEKTFFDSQAWLDSDCEDDFLSVNGDFTPSCGNTPKQLSNFAGTPLFTKLFTERAPNLNQDPTPVNEITELSHSTDGTPKSQSESSPTDKKNKLFQLFEDNIGGEEDFKDLQTKALRKTCTLIHNTWRSSLMLFLKI
ncbi:hypothetical protein GIB67_021043 [Kingdonia uniflora]|uniref:Ankyrin repeat domain-containing protein n=1 Tax=Kingdonia uniflora TaxID=39325 RepID=A0A7J7N791_9MAGN|nr:hypothetical protein GIB67_021043 [Kingdonia uniflora]